MTAENTSYTLTEEQEQRLIRQIMEGREAAEKLMASRNSQDGLDQKELERLKKTGRDAQSRLISAHQGLVIKIAREYYSKNAALDLDDFIEEGNLGLIEAAVRFDNSKGAKFSTYAAIWINRNIKRALADMGRTIRLPEGRQSELRKQREARQALEGRLGRKPTDRELAEKLGIGVERVRENDKVEEDAQSLNVSAGKGDEDAHLLNFFVDELAPRPEQIIDTLAYEQLCKALYRVIESCLTEEERDVLTYVYGLNGKDPHSFEQADEAFGFHGGESRDIVSEALTELRLPVNSAALREAYREVVSS